MICERRELDAEGRRLLGILDTCQVEELAAADSIIHPKHSRLFAAQRQLEEEVRALRIKVRSALLAFREHCKKISRY
jgi:hypothetical protein